MTPRTARWSGAASAAVALLALTACGIDAPAPTVASCTQAFTTAVREALNASTSMDDFEARFDALPIPDQCNGLSEADLEEVASRVQVNLMPDVMAKAFELGWTTP